MSDISLKVTSDSSQASQDLRRLTQSINNIEQQAQNTTKSLANLGKQISAAFIGFASISAVSRAADSFTNLGNRIALVTGRTEDLVRVQQRLFNISFRTGSAIQDNVDVFNKFGISLRKAGASYEDILAATESVAKAVKISGASAQSASAAIIQFGQGLASGVLRGQELNSVLEQAPRLAQAIADELGVTIGQLRALGEQGKLTSNQVFKALVNQLPKLSKEFETINSTISASFARLGTASLKLFGVLDRALGFSRGVAGGITNIAEFIFELADLLPRKLAILRNEFKFFYLQVKFFFSDLRIEANNFANAFNLRLFDLDFDYKQLDDIISAIKDFKASVSEILNFGSVFSNFQYNFTNTVSSVFGNAIKYITELFEELPNRINSLLFSALFNFVPIIAIIVFSFTQVFSLALSQTYSVIRDFFKELSINFRDIAVSFLRTISALIPSSITLFNLAFERALDSANAIISKFNVFSINLTDLFYNLIRNLSIAVPALVGVFTLAFDKVERALFSITNGFQDLALKLQNNLIQLFGGISAIAPSLVVLLDIVFDKLTSIFTEFINVFRSLSIKLQDTILSIFKALAAVAPSIILLTKFVFDKVADNISLFVNATKSKISDLFGEILPSKLDIAFTFKKAFNLSYIELIQFYFKLNKVINDIKESFSKISDSILSIDLKKYLPSLESVKRIISNFGKFVISVFYKIYDIVVGNSYWPDTIDGIYDYSRRIIPRVISYFNNFKNKIVDIFRSTLSSINNSTIVFNLKEAINSSRVDLSKSLSFDNIVKQSKKLYAELRLLFNSIVFEKIPSTVESAINGISKFFESVSSIKLPIVAALSAMFVAMTTTQGPVTKIITFFNSLSEAIRETPTDINIIYNKFIKSLEETADKIQILLNKLVNQPAEVSKSIESFFSEGILFSGLAETVIDEIAGVIGRALGRATGKEYGLAENLKDAFVGALLFAFNSTFRRVVTISAVVKLARGDKSVTEFLNGILDTVANFGNQLLQAAGITDLVSIKEDNKALGLIAGIIFGAVGLAFFSKSVRTFLLGFAKIDFEARRTAQLLRGLFDEKAGRLVLRNISTNGTLISRALGSLIPVARISGLIGGALGSTFISDIIKKIVGSENQLVNLGIDIGSFIVGGILGAKALGALASLLSDKLLKVLKVVDTSASRGGIALGKKVALSIRTGLLSLGLFGGIVAGYLIGEEIAELAGIESTYGKIGTSIAAAILGGFIGYNLLSKISTYLLFTLAPAIGLAFRRALATVAIAIALKFSAALFTIPIFLAKAKLVIAAIVGFFSLPVLFAALGVAAGAGIIYTLFFGKDDVSRKIQSVVNDYIVQPIKSMWESIKSGDLYKSFVQPMIDAIDKLATWFGDKIDFISSKIKEVQKLLGISQGEAEPASPAAAVKTEIEYGVDALSDALSGVTTNITSAMGDVNARDAILGRQVQYNPRDLILGRSSFLRDDSSNARDKLLIDFIKNQEGFLARAKFDYKQFSIGYGTRALPNEVSGNVTISEQEAERRLIEEVNKFRQEVEKFSTQFGYNFNQNQKDALTSFIYNLGPGALAQLTKDGTRSIEEISQSLLLYNRANNEILPGLVQRRELERALFDTTVPLTNGFQELSNNITRINSLVTGATGNRFATGGFVSGPGSSRSDSIPAMLSNGEFVVNAASTKRFFPILERINSGNFFGFRDGGVLKAKIQETQQTLTGSNAQLFNRIVVDLDFGKLSSSEIRDYTRQLSQLDRQRKESEKIAAKIAQEQSAENRKILEDDLKESNEQVQEIINTFVEQIAEKLPLTATEIRRKINEAIEADAREANKTFTESVRASFQDLFKGKISFQEFGTQIAESFTGKVVDIFAGRLIDAITGPGVKIFESIFYEVGSLGDGIGSAIKSGSDTLTDGLSQVFSADNSFLTSLKGIFTGGLDILQGAIGSFGSGGVSGSGILGFFSGLGFATGGRVSGPGTGKSDSIPAMLSNGEYVVNANSTRKALPLLEAINQGKIARFAEGGIVAEATAGQTTSVNQSLTNDQFVLIANSLTDISTQITQLGALVTQSASGITNTLMASLIPLGLGVTLLPFMIGTSIAASTALLSGQLLFWGNAILTAILASNASGALLGPFAQGGMITGPGTGKSDSILAQVSNGEFIINAAATRRNLPLLEAINSGNIPKFATGGLVDINSNAVSSATTTVKPINQESSINKQPMQQVFNINITGDISRQTKQEIYQMLPQIANGVNAYNKEKNLRGV